MCTGWGLIVAGPVGWGLTELPTWLGKDQLLTHIDANSNRMSGLPENMRYVLHTENIYYM